MGSVMHDDSDLRAWAQSFEVEEHDLELLNADQVGQVLCWPRGQDWQVRLIRKAGLSPAAVAEFDAWARERVYILAVTMDPTADGWFKRKSDDGWQITARVEVLPDMSFLDDPPPT